MVSIEEFARIRFSYIRSAAAVQQKPSDLWVLKSEGGNYDAAFGQRDGSIGFLPDEDLRHFRLMHWISINLLKNLKEVASEEKYRAVGRFHLAGIQAAHYLLQKNKSDFEKEYDNLVRGNENAVEKFWLIFWKCYPFDLSKGWITSKLENELKFGKQNVAEKVA